MSLDTNFSIPFNSDNSNSLSQDEVLFPNDISTYLEIVKGNLSNLEIQNLIKNVYVPSKDFDFPITKGRKFVFEWFARYPWLVYSAKLDGSFCLPCVLFGHKTIRKGCSIKNLFTEPFRSYGKASSVFQKHEGSHPSCEYNFQGLHKQTSFLLKQFQSNMSGRTMSVDVLIDSSRQKKNKRN